MSTTSFMYDGLCNQRMAALFEQQILEEVLDNPSLKGAQTWRQRVKDALFRVFLQYSASVQQLEVHGDSFFVTAYTVLCRVLVLAQLLGLLLVTQSHNGNWQQYQWALQALAFTRFDQIAVSVGAVGVFFYASAGVVFTACGALALMMCRAYYSLPPNHLVTKQIFAWVMAYLRGVGLIPTLSVLAAVVKYAGLSGRSAGEYLDAGTQEFDYGVTGAVVGVFALAGSAIVLLHIMLIYEQSQPRTNKNLRAKAHSLIDVLVHFVFYLVVGLLFSGTVHTGLHSKLLSVAVALPSLLASGLSLYYLPYYRLRQNVVWPGILNVFALAAAVMGLDYTNGDPPAAMAVLLLVSPLVVVLTQEAVQQRWQYISAHNSHDFESLGSHFLVELGVRRWVELVLAGQKQWQATVASAFNAATRKFKKKMMCVWETNFYFGVVQDVRLAMLKIAKAQLCPSSLESDFRVFCYSHELEQHHKRYEELEYLSFWHMLEDAKALDRKACHSLAAFWSELSLSNPRYRSLSRLASDVSRTIKLCVEKTKSALQSYRGSRQALTLLGTLLIDILNDPRGNEFLSKISSRHSVDKGYFSEDGAMLIVSGALHRIGEILYISEKAREVLEVRDIREVVGQNVTLCIPQPWGRKHLGWILRFLRYAESNSVNHAMLHLCKCTGFLVEVFAQIRVSYLNGSPFILVAFKPRELTREIVLLSRSGEILGHTKNVPSFVNMPVALYNGVNVDKLFPGLLATLALKTAGEIFSYHVWNTRKVLRLRLAEEQYCSQVITCLQILSESEEVRLLGTCYDTRIQSQYELLQSLSRAELRDASPHIEKNVGFSALSQMRVAIPRTKTAQFADIVDPALAQEPSKDATEVKISGSIGGSTSANTASVYEKADLRRVKTASWRLKAAILCLVRNRQIVFTTALSGACCGLIHSASDSFFDLSYLSVLRRGCYSVQVTAAVTALPHDPTARSALLAAVDKYQSVFSEMKDSAEKWRSGPHSLYYQQQSVVTWEYRDGVAHANMRNLFDAMQVFIDTAEAVGSGTGIKSADYLYIRRNGVGETLTALQKTTEMHIAESVRQWRRTEDTVLVVVVCGECVLVVLFFAVLIPSVGNMSRVHAQAWKRLLALKRTTLLKLRNECYVRLEFHHNSDSTAPHQFNPLESARRTQFFKRQWVGLAAKCSVCLFLSSAFLVVAWQVLCSPVFDLLVTSPKAIRELERQSELLQTVYFWAQEVVWGEESTWDWPSLHLSARTELDNTLKELRYSLKTTLNGFDLKAVDPGFVMQGMESDGAHLMMGLHCAMSLISLDPLDSAKDSLSKLKSDLSVLETRLQEGSSNYVSSLRSLLQQHFLYAVAGSVAYALTAFCLFLLYIPMVNTFRKQVTEVWKLYRIVPQAELYAEKAQ